MGDNAESSFDLSTPKVLKQCVDLFSSPKHDSYTIPVEINLHEKYADHPDIQHFKKIKSKNHYHYHKFKRTPKKRAQTAEVAASDFYPYSRSALMDRIASFSALNWNVPDCAAHVVNELKCAQNGWKCISVSIHNNSKNHLMCSSCKRFLTLMFNEFGVEGSSLDPKDVDELNVHLAQEYLTQITANGHDPTCPWRNFETPLKTVYYMSPFIDSTNDTLKSTYLGCLKSLVDNRLKIGDRVDAFPSLLESVDYLQNMETFKVVSNEMMLDRYFHDDKENQSVVLAQTPSWIYFMALLGWCLKVQSFSNHLVVFLVCSDCNKKVFLDSLNHPVVTGDARPSSLTGLDVSFSSILTPVKYPPTVPSQSASQYDPETADEDDEEIKLLQEHKPWCLRNVPWFEDQTVSEYLFKLICSQSDTPMVVDEEDPNNKRKSPFDINEGLERLNKLRKLYLVDD